VHLLVSELYIYQNVRCIIKNFLFDTYIEPKNDSTIYKYFTTFWFLKDIFLYFFFLILIKL